MAKKDTVWGKIFLGFGILTAISGLFLIFQQDYVGGVCGAIVGVLLIFLTNNKKNKNSRSNS